MRRPFAVPLLALALAAPSVAIADESVGGAGAPVVYGEDDRLDWYQESDPERRELGRNAVVAIVESSQITFGGTSSTWPPFTPGYLTLESYISSAEGMPLCSGERFADQPAIAGCSGTLIAPNLVVTAGHCFTNQFDCDNNRIVFDYFLAGAGRPEPITTDDVYSCARILARDQSVAPHLDYALVELDRDAVGRTPAPIRRARTALAVGTDVTVMGFGTGLPMKIDSGGEVTDARAANLDTFTMNTDTFAGNSGAGIFDDEGTLVGILVTGQLDYVAKDSCVTVNVIPELPGGESATYLFQAVDALCEAHSSHRLCRRNSGCSTSTGGGPQQAPSALLASLGGLAVAIATGRRRSRR